MNKLQKELVKIARLITSMTLDEAVDKALKMRDILDGVIDNIGEESPDDYEGAEVVADSIGGKWQAYRDGGDVVVVRNIKGEGFPNWDDVIEKVEKKTGISEENIREYCTDAFLDDLFWGDVRFEHEYIDGAIKGKLVVVGRSGGYWGLEYDWDMVELNERYIEDSTKKLLKDKRLIRKLLDDGFRYDEDEIEDHEVVDILVYELARIVWDKSDSDNLWQVNSKWKSEFDKLDRMITGAIKDFESSERWVDIIIANQYWEED